MEKTYTERIQIHKSNKLAALYPASKLRIALLYIVCTYIISTLKFTDVRLPLLLLPEFLTVLILCKLSGVMRESRKALKTITFISLFILFVQTFFVPGGGLVWQMGFLTIYEKGLQTGIFLSFMILNIAGIFVWIFQTTENREIASVLQDSGMNYKAVYVFTSTLQMIEVLEKNSKSIMNAQKARGVETEGNILIRARAFVPVLVPLMLNSVIGTEERVLTLEARGFSMPGKRTHLFQVQKSGYEKIAEWIAVIVTCSILAGRIYLWIR
ncbi:energy-coupling factor transporter transmembrane component T family protein [uncultured Robinsoniella sp.]|uniref:energy-coupling factor transporter transmembrane component T family protein n=1 Tax=uncultured Robinsoniella sp. TaxID=904190 RepID=UPI00374E8EBF